MSISLLILSYNSGRSFNKVSELLIILRSLFAPSFLIFQLMISSQREKVREMSFCSSLNALSPYTDHISNSISLDNSLLPNFFSLTDVIGIRIGTTS